MASVFECTVQYEDALSLVTGRKTVYSTLVETALDLLRSQDQRTGNEVMNRGFGEVTARGGGYVVELFLAEEAR